MVFGSNDQRQFHQTIAILIKSLETDSERVKTTQEESDDEIRTDGQYSSDKSSDTQWTVISDGEENNKKVIDITSPGLAAALDRTKINDRNATCSN